MIVDGVRSELDRLCKIKENVRDHKQFFKEKIKSRGITSSIVRDVSKNYFAQVKGLEKKEICHLCEELLKSGYSDEAKIAFDWMFRLKKFYTEKDYDVFYGFLLKYADNWGKVDDFCTHAFGHLLVMFPDKISELDKWAKSNNLWLRRASAVVLIFGLRKGLFFDDALVVANILLMDKEDLVQKGYGWMLKEATKHYQKEVFDFVMKNKHKMPRTALRYAIEKMPGDLRRKAMEK